MFIAIIYFPLYLFFFLSFPNIILSIIGPYAYKCLRDLKIKNLCAIEGSLTEEDEITLTQKTTKYLYVKGSCDSDEQCKKMGDSTLYQCFPKLKKLKIGEKCSVNEECYTGFCSMSICMGIDFEADCTEYPNGCKPGTYCAYNSYLNKKICVEYAYVNEICGKSDTLGYEIKCLPGLLCQIRDDNSGTTVCKKWGTFDLNKEVTDERLCKSGMAEYDDEVDGKLKCISVDEDGECDDETHNCTTLIVGIGENPDVSFEKELLCEEGLNNLYVCPLSNAKTKIFRKYIDEYNKKFDGEKLQKSQYFLDGYFNDRTMTELYIKYKYFIELKAYELIDFEGNINGLYSCEYDFFWNFLFSDIIKYNAMKICFILFLLF